MLKGFDERRLRRLLSLFFLALSIPTGVLIWQAYSQLKWEAFHQYRGMAEELSRRVDANLVGLVALAESRSFADYTFLVVTGDPSANFVQHSALSTYPVSGDLPGLLGYFQVDTGGEFSTPLLPGGAKPPEFYGLSPGEYAQRQALAEQLRTVLRDNRLAENRPVEYIDLDADSSQLAFDALNEAPSRAYRGLAKAEDEGAAASPMVEEAREQENKLGRVADLKLDSAYQEKSAELELAQKRSAKTKVRPEVAARVTRKEQISIPEPVAQAPGEFDDSAGSRSDLRINTFESEIDPLEFSLLNSGHFVLYRKVWRGGERYIQGMLIEQRAFIEEAIDRHFRETALSAMSDLIIAYGQEVLYTSGGGDYGSYQSGAGELDGALLFRSRLSAPFERLELIYSVNALPPGPGAEVLGWVSLVLGLVLCSGFYALYRVGVSQIELARQQQDFVSAVSHELKTPLTSIRMYGEMLREGWAAADKKQQYYEFIHEESERLSRLISNVLQLANISRNEPRFEMKPLTVGEIMAAIEAKIGSQVQHADFELVFHRDPDIESLIVNIDPDCFAQIIINLVDNAIKFSRNAAQKRIEISSGMTGDGKVLFSVRDFGPGIPKNQMRKIFDMFYRSESELTRETVGTGIGLAIVHQLSLAMKAEVDVLNREPGAEFRVSVPVDGVP